MERISRRKFLVCSACMAGMAALSACGASSSGEPQPPKINYGRDVCKLCGMIISDPQFAAATQLKAGGYNLFDDIGDMIVYHLDHPNEMVGAHWVNDYTNKTWLRGETATYVQSKQVKSPMGSGIAAFAAADAAKTFAARVSGRVMTFDEVKLYTHLNLHDQAWCGPTPEPEVTAQNDK